MIENTKEIPLFAISNLRNWIENSNVLSLDNDFLVVDNLKDKAVTISDLEPSQAKDHMVYFLAEGAMKIRVNWNVYDLGPRDVISIKPGDICQMLSIQEGRLMIISFNESFVEQKIDSKLAMLFLQYAPKMVTARSSEIQFEKVLAVYYAIRDILSAPNFKFKEMALNGVMQVAVAFGCQWLCEMTDSSVDENKPYSTQQKLFDRFLELVVEHHDKERSVMFYASQLCITPKYLSQVVVRVSGRYAVDIIRDQVIFKAKALLRSRQFTVQQVSDMLSFPNPSFFGKYFKQEVGMSPRQYMMG